MTTYREKLLDPRWQKRRLEILNRDEFVCQKCFDDKSTLHIHHLYYTADAEPWDAADGQLITLCAECHQAETDSLRGSIDYLVGLIRLCGYMSDDFERIGDAITYFNIPYPAHVKSHLLSKMLGNKDVQDYLVAEYFKNIKKQNLSITDKGAGDIK